MIVRAKPKAAAAVRKQTTKQATMKHSDLENFTESDCLLECAGGSNDVCLVFSSFCIRSNVFFCSPPSPYIPAYSVALPDAISTHWLTCPPTISSIVNEGVEISAFLP